VLFRFATNNSIITETPVINCYHENPRPPTSITSSHHLPTPSSTAFKPGVGREAGALDREQHAPIDQVAHRDRVNPPGQTRRAVPVGVGPI
jgi:hypothetical protein